MTSRSIVLLAAAMVAAGATAAPLTPERALARLEKDMPNKARAMVRYDRTPAYTARTVAGAPAAYVFNQQGGGYMILGGDDIAYPLLGYSDSGSISATDMPESMKWWLSEYARQIEYAAEHGEQNSPTRVPRYNLPQTAIAPLIKTRWNQDAPFNKDCPTTRDGKMCPTGCVATSMAQVMNYFQYPEVGEGIKQYTCSSLNRKLTINFAKQAFDWQNMIDYYGNNYTEEQANAVAYLMKACGFSVEMKYAVDASGAHGFDIATALTTYFKYDEGVHSSYRNPYSSSQWANMIYENLKNIGPVVINGQAPLTGGHSFVCDGYDGDGYFHINWGWGGMSDGYFAIDALDPDAQGIGGAEGGFNFQQNVIFGIQPPTGEPAVPREETLFQWGTTTAEISGRTITFGVKDSYPLGWGNLEYPKLQVNVGAIVTNVDNTESEIYVQGKLGNMETVTFVQGSLYGDETKPTVTLPELPDGTYKVTLASRSTASPDQPWIPVKTTWGLINYVMLKVDNGVYTVSEVAPHMLKVSDVQLASAAYCAKNMLIKAKFTNDSDLELLQGLTPRLLTSDGAVKFYGSSMLIAVDPNSSIEKDIVVKFYNENGTYGYVSQATDFILKFFDPQTNLYYEGVELPITLNPNPGNAQLQLTAFNITDAVKGDGTVDGRYYHTLYFVEDTNEITGRVSIKSKRGYYDGVVTLNVMKADKTDPYLREPVLDGVFSAYPFLENGETMSFDYKFSFPKAEGGVVYFLTVDYTNGNKQSTLDTLPFALPGTNVTDIEADSSAVEYYNLQGVRIDAPVKGEPVIVKKGAKVSKMIAR